MMAFHFQIERLSCQEVMNRSNIAGFQKGNMRLGLALTLVKEEMK